MFTQRKGVSCPRNAWEFLFFNSICSMHFFFLNSENVFENKYLLTSDILCNQNGALNALEQMFHTQWDLLWICSKHQHWKRKQNSKKMFCTEVRLLQASLDPQSNVPTQSRQPNAFFSLRRLRSLSSFDDFSAYKNSLHSNDWLFSCD